MALTRGSRSRRSRRSLVGAIALGFGLVAAACGGGTSDVSTASPVTDQGGDSSINDALTGEFQTVDGQTVDLAAYRDSDLVLWFWAPW